MSGVTSGRVSAARSLSASRAWGWVVVPLLAVGCASSGANLDPDTVFGEVGQLVSDRSSIDLAPPERPAADRPLEGDLALGSSADTAAEVGRWLSEELTLERAVSLALVNNQDLLAEYQELGISRAEVIEAGLLSNPVLSASARIPDHAPRRAILDLGLAQSLLDLLVRPARRQLATVQLERAQMRTADAVLELAAEVEMAWIEAVSAAQVVDMRRLVADSTETSYQLAVEIHRAGNASDLELTRERSLYENARLELARAEGEANATREAVHRWLGLWGDQITWQAPSRLPELPADEISLDRLESLAIAQRLDLAALGKTVETRALALGIKKRWRYLLSAEIGVEAEREGDDEWSIGPSLHLELPIFDRGQADLERLRAELRQSEHKLRALAVEVRSRVRELRDHLVLQRQLAEHYRQVVIPLHERTVELTQLQYNYMLVGTFELLQAKREEYDAYQAYIETVRDYHLTKAKLKHALGGGFEPPMRESAAGTREHATQIIDQRGSSS